MKQGLFGAYRFRGKQGALAYVRQAGCIQYDPIDTVGRNAELTLQSRVSGFRKKDLSILLYRDRALFDYFDKELAVLPVEDWPYFERYRALCRENGRRFAGLAEAEEKALAYLQKHTSVNSASLPVEGAIPWHSAIHWSGDWTGKPVNAARAVLEQLYTTGDLVIHHKEGTRKYYALAEKYLPQEILSAPDPLPQDYDHMKWRVKRRIGAAGMLWNRNSTAFLGITGMTPAIRDGIFAELAESGEICAVHAEGIRSPLYILSDDLQLLEEAEDDALYSTRCEFLAPLDPMLWDRELIRKLFGFSYTWEIYTPREKRNYGYYVLPVLYGEGFAGRIEPVIVNGELTVKGFWPEEGIRKTKRLNNALNGALKRLARFNQCECREMIL